MSYWYMKFKNNRVVFWFFHNGGYRKVFKYGVTSLTVIITIFLALTCYTATDKLLRQEFKDEGWKCNVTRCDLIEGSYIYRYKFVSNSITYKFNDQSFGTLDITVDIDIASGDTSMYAEEQVYYVWRTNYDGNIYTNEFTCVADGDFQDYCNSEHVDRAYNKIKPIIEGAGLTREDFN